MQDNPSPPTEFHWEKLLFISPALKTVQKLLRAAASHPEMAA